MAPWQLLLLLCSHSRSITIQGSLLQHCGWTLERLSTTTPKLKLILYMCAACCYVSAQPCSELNPMQAAQCYPKLRAMDDDQKFMIAGQGRVAFAFTPASGGAASSFSIAKPAPTNDLPHLVVTAAPLSRYGTTATARGRGLPQQCKKQWQWQAHSIHGFPLHAFPAAV